MRRKVCNPCKLSDALVYCGEDLDNTGIKKGDKYKDVLEKIDDAIQGSGGGDVPETRMINTGNGLTGGGSLENDLTIELDQTTIDNLDLASTAVQPSALGNYVPVTRTVSAGTGLTGGGALSVNQTLSLSTETINSLNLANSSVQPSDLDNYIPLSGTEVGSPVTGTLEMGNDYNTVVGTIQSMQIGIGDDLNIVDEAVKVSFLDFTYGDERSTLDLVAKTENNNITLRTIVDEDNEYSSIEVSTSRPDLCKGINSDSYFGANYDDNTYVQKKYVDDKILYGSKTFTLSGSDTVFTITHGMTDFDGNPLTPSSFALTFSDGGNLDFIQSERNIDDTNITITCITPPNGEITVFWQVFK